jgi:hypothetical protein
MLHIRNRNFPFSPLKPTGSELGAGRSNVVVTLAVFGLIIALFFIPEIIGMQGSIKPKADDRDADSQAVEQAALESDLSPLQDLLRQTEGRASLGPDAFTGEELASPDSQQGIIFPSGQGSSWDEIKTKQVRKELTSASRTIRGLLGDIPIGYIESRQALFIYSSALQQMLRSGKRFISAAEVVPLLDQLDRNVTTAMLREGVERGVFMRWQEMSLGPILQSSVAYRLRQQIDFPYRPDFGIESVRIFQAADSQGKRNPEASVRMRLRLYVRGSDTARIDVFRNGELFFSRPVRKRGDIQGRRRFIVHTDPNIIGVRYIVQVTDHSGANARKHYRFDQHLHRLQWNRTFGLFSIPLPNFDPRLDRLFLVGTDRGGDRPEDDTGPSLDRF